MGCQGRDGRQVGARVGEELVQHVRVSQHQECAICVHPEKREHGCTRCRCSCLRRRCAAAIAEIRAALNAGGTDFHGKRQAMMPWRRRYCRRCCRTRPCARRCTSTRIAHKVHATCMHAPTRTNTVRPHVGMSTQLCAHKHASRLRRTVRRPGGLRNSKPTPHADRDSAERERRGSRGNMGHLSDIWGS